MTPKRITQRGLVLVSNLVLVLGGWGTLGSSISVAAAPQRLNRFAEWCLNQTRLSPAQQQTVQVLLQQAHTQDCQQAEQALLKMPQLSLGNRQIKDVSPLASLPHLTSLDLSFNQISDITPLANLTQLTFLLLAGNQITDVTPLAKLTQLTYLVLEKNQIREISSLSGLTRLRNLIVLTNPLATKNCPLRPATICIFSNDGQDLYAQAESQYQQGDFQAALKTFQAVLEVYTKADDRVKQADTLNRIGDTSINLGQYAQALSFYQTAAKQRRELGDRPGMGVSLTSLASAYERLGQYQKARETLEQALGNIKEQQQGGIPLEGGIYELPKDEAAVYNRLALVQNQLKQHQDALRSAQQALKLYQLLPDGYEGKRFGERTVLDTIGVTYSYLGQSQAAISALKQAVAIAQELGDRAGEATSLNHLGELYVNLEQPRSALELLQQALSLRQKIGDKPGQGATLNTIGITLLRQGNAPQATQTLLTAIEIWESLRPGLTDENKVSLFETQAVTYSALQQALIAQNQTASALAMAERSRARAFVELLASRLGAKASQQFASAAPPTVEQIRQIAKTYQATLVEYSIVEETLLIWVIQPSGVIDLRSVKLTDLETSLEETLEKTRVVAATGINRGVSAPGLNQLVQGTRDTITASASTTADRGLGVVATGTPTDRAQSDTTRRRYRRLRQSYDLLIAPIADLLPKDPKARVIFVPHGPLFLIPFPALQDEQGTYLVERHTVLTTPSIQVLAFTRQHKNRNAQRNSAALVVGNPTMPSISFNPEEPPQPLSPLPGAGEEAIAIAQILQTQPLTGDAATEAVVIAQMRTARLVHLATHGLLGDLNHLGFGVPGAIALAPEPTKVAKTRGGTTLINSTSIGDGLLTANQILDLNLAAELVVLSACDTGRGTITGDGVIGLSRSFMAAGVPSVLVSLWEVPDTPTSELMIEFYRQLQQQPDKAQALRQAMLMTLQKYTNPRDWAAFTLIGEP